MSATALFKPYAMFHRIGDITPEYLRSIGVKALALDADNTLSTHHSQTPDDGVEDWLRSTEKAGIKLIMVSNSKAERVAPFAKKLGLDFTSTACKPLPHGFLRAARKLGVKRSELAAVGDQLFTDMLGAHLAGIKGLLVEPIKLESSRGFRFKRALERPLLKRYKRTVYSKGGTDK